MRLISDLIERFFDYRLRVKQMKETRIKELGLKKLESQDLRRKRKYTEKILSRQKKEFKEQARKNYWKSWRRRYLWDPMAQCRDFVLRKNYKKVKKHNQRKNFSPPITVPILFCVLATFLFFGYVDLSFINISIFSIVSVIIALIIFVFFTFEVEINHIAHRKWFGGFVGKQVGPGLHTKLPLQEIQDMDSSISDEQPLDLGDFVTPTPENATFRYEKPTFKYQIFDVKEHMPNIKSFRDTFKKMVAEAIQGFINDPKNPPNNYDEFLTISNKKLVARIIAKSEGRDWPRYESGENKGKFLSEDDMRMLSSGESLITQKEQDLANADHLINGDGKFFISVGGVHIVQLSLLKPVPTGDFKKKFDERMEQEQEKKIQEKEAEVEIKRRDKEFEEYKSFLMRYIPLAQKMGWTEAFRAVCILDQELTKRLERVTKEYVVRLEGSSEKFIEKLVEKSGDILDPNLTKEGLLKMVNNFLNTPGGESKEVTQ